MQLRHNLKIVIHNIIRKKSLIPDLMQFYGKIHASTVSNKFMMKDMGSLIVIIHCDIKLNFNNTRKPFEALLLNNDG